MLSATTLFPPSPRVAGAEDAERVDPHDTAVSLQEMLRARLPRLIVTPAILTAIVAVFVVMVVASGEVSFSSPTLKRWGAQVGPDIAIGQWWRLLTAMQFHANGLSMGASGAIFGLVGILLIVAMTSRGSGVLGDMLAELLPNLMSVVVANLMLGFMLPGIDNAAHVGGLGGGLVFGWLVGRHSLDAIPSPLTLIPILLTAGVAVAAVVAAGWRDDVRTDVARVAEGDERVTTAIENLSMTLARQ